MTKKQLTRRDFIKSSTRGLAALGMAAGSIPLLDLNLSAADTSKPKVIVAQDARSINSRNQANLGVVTELIDKSLFALTGKSSSADAWKVLGLNQKDVVAIKINCNTWTIQLRPHPELVQALCNSLKSVIPENQIIIYERSNSDLERGGFTINDSANGVRFFGNDHGGGYHPKEKITRILTDTCTKIINLASLKCVDGDFGVSLFMKNHIGSLRDSDMPLCHGNPDFLAQVSNLPSIRNKTILNLCDGLRATYKRGVPWYWGGIVMGQDAVASECATIQVVNEKRKAENITALDLPKHLTIAEKKYKLGSCQPEIINV